MLYLLMASMIAGMGCSKDSTKADEKELEGGIKPNDTAVETETDPENCETTIVDTMPAAGEVGWFYRDPIQLTFSESNPTVGLTLTNGADEEIAVGTTWDDARINLEVLPESGSFDPSESYTLAVSLCGSAPSIDFVISEVGSELDVLEADLIGNTYLVDLSEASYLYPPGADQLLSLAISEKLLFGVAGVSAANIDFRASLGERDDVSGDYSIYGNQWEFLGADFADSPYFVAATDKLTIPYGDAQIDLYDFSISGVFAPDGQSIVAVEFATLGDTRYLGPNFSLGDDPGVICDTILGPNLGIECELCPDGNPWCITLIGELDEIPRISNFNINDYWEAESE